MACSNPYDWINQSENHRDYSWDSFPLMAELASITGSDTEFRDRLNTLGAEDRVQYNKEYNTWWQMYGFAWDKLNCPNEQTVGQKTAGYQWTDPNKPSGNIAEVKAIQTALLNAGYNPGVIDGKWGPNTCKAAYKYKKELLFDYNTELDWNFFSNLKFSNATSEAYERKYGNACNNWYVVTTGEVKSDCQAIQQALLKQQFNPGPQDGNWTAQTCTALLDFAKHATGSDKTPLTSDTFFALGFDDKTAKLYSSLYGGKCVRATPAQPIVIVPTITTNKKTCPSGAVLTWRSDQSEPKCPQPVQPTQKTKKCADGSVLNWMSNQQEPACPAIPVVPVVKEMSKTCSDGSVLKWMNNQTEPQCPTIKKKTCSDGSTLMWMSNQQEPACPEKKEEPGISMAGIGLIAGGIIALGLLLSGGTKKGKK